MLQDTQVEGRALPAPAQEEEAAQEVLQVEERTAASEELLQAAPVAEDPMAAH